MEKFVKKSLQYILKEWQIGIEMQEKKLSINLT